MATGESKESVSLRDYFDVKIDAIEKIGDSRYISIEKSTILAADALNERLNHMNNLLAFVKESQGLFQSKENFELLHHRIEEDIKILQISKAELAGKASQKSVNQFFLISIIALIISLLTLAVLIIKH